MNNEEEINILKRAGFFQDGEDAVSLIAAFESMQIEIEQLRKEREELLKALRAIAYYEGDKFPWMRPELVALGEKREDYLEFMDPDDLTDEEYAAMYGEESDTTPTKEGSD
jgi:hypothetical protein